MDANRQFMNATKLSRFDLIAAGADFTLLNSEQGPCLYDETPGEKWQVKSYPSRKSAKICFEKSFDPDFVLAEFYSAIGFSETRRKVAQFIESIDYGDADALRAPWSSQGNIGWPEPGWAFKEGLNLNALLYSAAQHGSPVAVRMYLSAGADPLAYTYDGDCAARIGVANSMIKVFNRPEWLNAATVDTGETGLHWLAVSHQHIEIMQAAIRLGASPDQRDCDGISALDLIHSKRDRTMLDMTISEQRASRLRKDTIEVAPSFAYARSKAMRL